MKRLTCFSAALLALTFTSAFAGEAPRGSVLELHSCELYAGGCTVSSEAPQDGRYMLRVWNVSSGSFNGADLAGLRIAALQFSPDNLAAKNSKSGEAVVYLPESATQSQRDALLAWLKSSQADLKSAKIQTRTAPLQFAKADQTYDFSAGNFISVKVSSMDSCEIGSCGEELWYEPRAATSLFTVVVNRESKVSEPLLKLNWTDGAKRSVFLGRFGETDSNKEVYVTMNELCGAAKSLF